MMKPERCGEIERGLDGVFGGGSALTIAGAVEEVVNPPVKRRTKDVGLALDRLVERMGARVRMRGQQIEVMDEGVPRKKEELIQSVGNFLGSKWNVMGHLLTVAMFPRERGGHGMSVEEVRDVCRWYPMATVQSIPEVGKMILVRTGGGTAGWAQGVIDLVFRDQEEG